MMTYGQGVACALMGLTVGWLLAIQATCYHLTRCCFCSSVLLQAISNRHDVTVHIMHGPCLLEAERSARASHAHHGDRRRPPGPPAGSHP